MSCGIYCIENKINEKKYVGQSVDIEKRWKTHLIQLNNNKHSNEYLQRSWVKYGEESFDFYIIEICVPEMLNEREKYWIDYFDSFINGYNLTSGGDGGNTIAKYTDEQLTQYRKKKSILHSEIALKGEGAPCSKLTNSQVLEIIDRLISGDFNVDIANDYNVSASTIYDIRAHNTWNSLTDGIEFAHTSKKYGKYLKGKAVAQYDLLGNHIKTYISAREAEKETGCSYKHISSVCRGKRNTCGGYIWRFIDDSEKVLAESALGKEVGVQNSKPVALISENNDIINSFRSIAEAAKYYNISESGISNVCKGKAKQTHKMLFRFLSLEEFYTLDSELKE